MLISGILSIFQVLFLPGFLLLFFLNMHRGIIRCLLLSCALSMIINFFIVYFLTLLHLYTSFSVYLLVAIEISILFLFRHLHLEKYECFPADEYAFSGLTIKEYFKNITIVHVIIFSLATLIIAQFVLIFCSNAEIVFYYRDALLNFNRWAISWYQGHLPTQTWDYPQLLSTNWSLTYQFIFGSTVQMFASALTAIIPLFTLFVLVDLGLRKKHIAYFIGIIFLASFLLEGNASIIEADILCGFYTLISFYLLIQAKSHSDLKMAKRLFYLGAVTAAGAALTKQGGLFIAILYPFLGYLLVLKKKHLFRKPGFAVLKCVFIILVLLLPWYLYMITQIILGNEQLSYASMLTESLEHSYLARISFAMTVVWVSHYGKIFSWIIVPLAVIFGIFANKTYGKIFIWFVLPYFIIWVFFFSYDSRNLSVVSPLIAIMMGYGIYSLLTLSETLLRLRDKISKACAHLIITFVVLIILLGYYNDYYNASFLIKKQTQQKMLISYPALNQFVYTYFKQRGYNATILTNLLYTDSLPVINKMFIHNDFISMQSYYDQLHQLKPGYLIVDRVVLGEALAVKRHISMSRVNSDAFLEKLNVNLYIKNKILLPLQGHYKILFEQPGYIFVKINAKNRGFIDIKHED